MNGFSPTATVTKSGSTATIRITDKNGTTTATIVDGNNYVLTNADKEDIAEEVANMINISSKADKATTLAGYGINNAYTKSEVDAAIQTAIGSIETQLSQI